MTVISISYATAALALCIAPFSGAFNAASRHPQSVLRPIETGRNMMSDIDIGGDNCDENENENENEMRTLVDRRNVLFGAGGILSSLPLLYSDISSSSNSNSNENHHFLHIPTATASTTSTTSTKEFPTVTLSNGVNMPMLALNTAGLSREDSARACSLAVTKYGFTHIDFHPGSQRDGVADFMKSSTNKSIREKLFLNTKIRKPPPGTSPSDAAQMVRSQIEEDKIALNIQQFDMLMLRDSPDCDVMREQWKVMEEALSNGSTRSIGVVNYCEKSLNCLLKTAKVKPAVNYYYSHVGMTSTGVGYKLKDYCDRKKIKTFAYGAFGEPGPSEELLNSTLLKNIGDATKNVYNYRNHGESSRTPEEICLRWLIQSGVPTSVRPTLEYGLGKSVCASTDDGSSCDMGLKERAGVFDWSLTGEEMNKLTYILKSDENPTIFSSTGCPDSFVMTK